MRIDVHNGEIYDKMSILKIKLENGLAVEEECRLLQPQFDNLLEDYPESVWVYDVLQTLNRSIWEVENNKRRLEAEQNFDVSFVTTSRLVYFLNDERARIKRIINTITNSEIKEVKGHAGLE